MRGRNSRQRASERAERCCDRGIRIKLIRNWVFGVYSLRIVDRMVQMRPSGEAEVHADERSRPEDE